MCTCARAQQEVSTTTGTLHTQFACDISWQVTDTTTQKLIHIYSCYRVLDMFTSNTQWPANYDIRFVINFLRACKINQSMCMRKCDD